MRTIICWLDLFLSLSCLFLATQSAAVSVGSFEKIATFTEVGGMKGAAVGPGPDQGSQWLYLDYMYIDDTVEIVGVDPKTGNIKSFPNPASSESGAYGLILGSDGNMYVGTLPNAHLYRLDTKKQKLEDLGTPASGEQYIWSLTEAADKKIYGVTYPNCKLISYDLATGKMQDLGRMDPQEQYARYIAAGDDGFLYISTGPMHAGVVAYNIAKGTFNQILPETDRGRNFYDTYVGADGKIYATGLGNAFQLENGKAIKLSADQNPPPIKSEQRLSDGSYASVSSGAAGRASVDISRGGKTIAAHPYLYKGRALNIYRLGAAPNGMLYGSSVLPLYFFSLNLADAKLISMGKWGDGETYSFLGHEGKVLLANYSANSILMSYDPGHPLNPGDKPGSNPLYVSYAGADHAWRPMAMISGNKGKVYVGAVPGYGALAGPLVVWDTAANKVQVFNGLIHDQSIVSLAAGKNDIIYGGTSVGGGGGAIPTQKNAVLFAFDSNSQKVTFQIIPVSGTREITDLIMAPNGKLFGFADQTLFEYDPATQQVQRLAEVDYGSLVYNTITSGPEHAFYGLASKGIFRLDPVAGKIRLFAKSPAPITAGGALIGKYFYFGSGADIYRYKLP